MSALCIFLAQIETFLALSIKHWHLDLLKISCDYSFGDYFTNSNARLIYFQLVNNEEVKYFIYSYYLKVIFQIYASQLGSLSIM